jgi:hypothetical protein
VQAPCPACDCWSIPWECAAVQVEAADSVRNPATCDICSCPAETQTHVMGHIQIMIQCVCPGFKGARIAAHHTRAGMIFNIVREAGGGSQADVHRELEVRVAAYKGPQCRRLQWGDWY